MLFGRELHSILVGTDGSLRARDAEDVAGELAAGHNAQLHIVHVVHPVDVVGETFEQPGYSTPHEPGEGEYALLETAKARAEARGIGVTSSLRLGTTVDEIVSYADTCSIDLIVLGSHGHGGLAGLFLGSVSRGVMHKAKHPVLIVRGIASMDSAVRGGGNLPIPDSVVAVPPGDASDSGHLVRRRRARGRR